MLYTYKHIPHDFEKLHSFISHTVLNVWCKPRGAFSVSMLHIDFQPMVVEISKNKNDYLLSPIRLIYNRFTKLSPENIKKIRQGFHDNNAIEDLCMGKRRPMLFEFIKRVDRTLHDYLQKFGKNLYKHVTTLKSCIAHAGDLNDHYKKLVEKNKSELCPFCGLNDIKSERLSKRDDFDHYLSKDKYPFNSVNPLNLAPMCGDCNKSYKLQHNPILDQSNRKRKAFYPFSASTHTIKIDINLNSANISSLKISDFDISFSCKGRKEELAGWLEIFGIEERYKDKCCKDKDGKTWYRKVVDDCHNYGKSPKQMYNAELRTAKARPLTENNFLRIPFLEACCRKGIIK